MSSMRSMIKGIMMRAGYENFHEAHNGIKAWEMIEAANTSQDPYGLILCDWNMPKMTGLELLKQVREAEAGHHRTPFLMITAESKREQVIEAISHDVDNYLVKPLTPASVLQRVKAVWDKYHPASSQGQQEEAADSSETGETP
jgi:two-component system chemotaxis response regulator CheY